MCASAYTPSIEHDRDEPTDAGVSDETFDITAAAAQPHCPSCGTVLRWERCRIDVRSAISMCWALCRSAVYRQEFPRENLISLQLSAPHGGRD